MFSLINYYFNSHAIPVFFSGFFMLFFGSLLYFKNPPSRIYFSFLLICISVSVWLLATAMGYLCNNEAVASFWFKCDNFGVMFISVSIYFFITSYLHLDRKKSIIFGFTTAFILGLIALSTDLLVTGAKKYYWGFFPKWGILCIPTLALFFGYMWANLTMLFSRYKKTASLLEKNQLKYIFIAFLGAYTGSVDYLPALGFEIYPFGYISTIVFLSILAYAIFKYRVMDIKVAITRAGIFTIVYTLVLGIPFAVGAAIAKLNYDWWWLAPTMMAVLASAGPFLYMRLQKRVEARLRAEEFKAQNQLRRLSHNMLRFTNLEGLLKLIVHQLVKIFKLKFAAIYLIDKQSNKYMLKSFWQVLGDITIPVEFSEGSLSLHEIITRRLPIVTEELKLTKSSQSEKLVDILLELKINTIIPSFMRQELLGFLILSDRRTNITFTQEDLNLLMVLSNEAALAIENAQFHQKERSLLAEQSRREALADMAPGASHQFNNRLAAISSSVELILFKLENLNIDAQQDENIKTILKDTKQSLELIDNEVYKGKEITSAILKRATAKVEFQSIDIKSIIDNAYKLVSISRTKSSVSMPDFKMDVLNEIPLIFGSEALLQDCFYNLIDNAFDAIQDRIRLISKEELSLINTPDYKGHIEVTIKNENGSLEINIKDNGIGIKKEGLKKLFAPYFTTKATSDKGTGLGLYIIRDFVEMHKGTITCDSEYGVGAAFTIKLPINKK